jgi:hypothetical protein
MDLNRLAGCIQSVIISEVEPDDNIPEGWLWPGLFWFNASTGIWYKWNGSAWEQAYNPFHNANFTGTLSADGQEGVSGTKVTPIGTLTFTKGLLTDFIPA